MTRRYDAMERGFGPLLIFMVILLNMSTQLSHMLAEKELHLREALNQIGLISAACVGPVGPSRGNRASGLLP